MSNTTILQWGPHDVQPDVFEQILNHAVEHRPWFQDNIWNAGEAVRRATASSHLADALTSGRVWEAWRGAELLGIFVLNNVRPGIDAQAHFLFFDRQLANKRQLCREMMRTAFEDEDLQLHALRVDLPEYASKLAWFLRNALGFKFEAERRLKDPKQAEKASRRYQGAFYEGKWVDVLLLSLTKIEFNEAQRSAGSSSNASLESAESQTSQRPGDKPGRCEHSTTRGPDARGDRVPSGDPPESPVRSESPTPNTTA